MEANLYTMALRNMDIGCGPEVYLDINRGKAIWTGVKGTASKANVSRFTPYSINFSPTIDSSAKPT